jgi:acyl transferase domain-containing protein/NADPH:quinone reductase-like Zn-dependent oxidoreductase/acyl carrier protein
MTDSTDVFDIAVTGYACRVPGARTPAEFWQVLSEGRCTITEVRPDRFRKELFWDPDPRARGKSYTFAAGQLDSIWDFDPGFFSLSHREAAQMDPQQRILLQVAWEAVEHAGLRPSAMAGERTGVFIGASASDYSNQFFMDLARIDAQFMTGNTLSILSNRVSYLLNLKGPSFTVDTACSSSFYALHEAAKALMAGDIDTAIVGGVNLLISPAPFVGFSRASMLSPKGLCRAFDAAADGYVRSEGAVVFVLRRLAAARANGDRIRGIIAGTGINSDGRTVGMALPSAQRQADLLRHMRDRFGLDPDALAFVEAHGTGTPVGDPVEAHAIGTVIGQSRSAPLPIGSAKTNFGHLEPTSGLVGLLKAQLALENGVYPASLHLATPNPNIDFGALNLVVAKDPVVLPARGGPWWAGINSFGFGGANAHVLLRQPRPEEQPAPEPAPAPRALFLSAQSAESLSLLAAAWRDRIAAAPASELPALANGAAWRRDQMSHRLVALGRDRDGLVAALDDHAAGRKSPAAVLGRSARIRGKTAFVFSGNGSQWAGMGRHLHATDPVFRARFDEVSATFAAWGDTPVAAHLMAEDLDSRLGSALVAQPLLFAVQMGLVAALAAEGLVPHAVAGHSVGEVAAACTAGSLTLRDAVRLIHTRSLALDTLRGTGGMAAISAGAADVAGAIEEAGLTGLCIAGTNSPRSVTVSGPKDEIKALLAWLRRHRRIAGVMLEVEIPYHSAAVEPLRRRMIEDLKGLRPLESPILYASSTTGQLAHGLSLDTDYWWHNARDVVRFDDAVEALCEAGCQTFVEISPRPVLQTYVRDKLRALGHPGTYAKTMDQGAAAETSAHAMVAQALAEGAEVDLARFLGPKVPAGPDLPAYPWANAVFRAEPTSDAANNWGQHDWHPLLGRSPLGGETVWQSDINPRSIPWLADHALDGAAVFPAAGFVEIALAAGSRMLRGGGVELADLEILRPLVLDSDGGADVRTTADALTGAVRIEARPRLTAGDWALHAFGTVRGIPSAALPEIAPVPDGTPMDAADLYAMLAGRGLAYGPSFALADLVRSAGTRATALIRSEAAPDDSALLLNPAMLDSALHAILPVLLSHATADRDPDAVFLPVRVGRLRLLAPGGAAAEARVEITRRSPRGIELRLLLLDAHGAAIAAAEGVRLQVARLRGRGRDEPFAWRERLIRLRAPDRMVTLPKGWAVAAQRLRALGVAADAEPEPDAGAILIDAVCRRIAWDCCSALADREGRIAAETAAIAPSARPLVGRMIAALAEDGLYAADRAGGTLASATIYPRLDQLVSNLAAAAPDRAADLQDLMRIETALPSVLREGLRTEPPPLAGVDLSAAGRGIWAALRTVLADLAGDWPEGDRLNILILGSVPPGMIAELAALPRVGEIVASSPSPRIADLLGRTLPRLPQIRVLPLAEALAPLSHDVIVAADSLAALSEEECDRLSGSLALAGLVIAAEQRPSLAQDLREGLQAAWWAEGARRRATDWAQHLTPAFRDIAVLPLASGAVEADLIVARPRQHAVRARLPETGDGSPRHALLVLADRRRKSLRLAALVEASLAAAGMDVRLCHSDDSLAMEAAAADVIHIAHLPGGSDEPLAAAMRRIATLRAILARPERPARIWLVTAGARTAPRTPAEAAPIGAARVLANEYPAVRFRSIDFAASLAPEAMAEEICGFVLSGTAETEIVVDATGLRAPRIEPAPRAGQRPAAGDALRLEARQQGVLDSLAWEPVARRPPAPDEVEVEVRATGLNFRDLMWAQGLLPEEALEDGFAGATLGMECAGVVARAGRASGFQRGDEVIVFAPSAFATHVTVAANAVARMPQGLAFETAAAVPTIFVTAAYALGPLARLHAGEVLLVHGGAGGVGLAALQIARRVGARVFATAGTPAKRRLLQHLGAERVFDSRSLTFADEVMAATGGRGVDVVLNSLAGEAMERSIACLAPFGRFVELGKRDFYANTRVGLRPFRKNLSYFGVDADQLLKERQDLAERLLADIARGFGEGHYSPPPIQSFDAAEIVDAFRLMQQSRHVGKIVVRPPAAPAASPAVAVPVRGAWLIAGGLGGFGLATAGWLLRQGAASVWLVSRSGAPRPEDQPALAALRAGGAAVEVRAADITRPDAVLGLLNEIAAGEHPLRGIVHAAMVLDDAMNETLDAGRIERVMAPKIAGAAVLDRLSRTLAPDLEHFILYSSVTTLFGNPGQLPYVAANGYLEALARQRREAGLPALAVAWGPIADAGYLSRETRTRDMLGKRMGARMLSAAEALDMMGAVIAAGAPDPVISLAPMRWRMLAPDLALLAQPLFARIDMGGGGVGEGVAGLLEMIEGLPEEEAIRKVTEALAAETARILRQPLSDIDPYQPLTELGFDSLMAMDLKLAAEEAMGVTIPLLSIGDGMTLVQLSARIVGQLRGQSGTVTGDREGDRMVTQHLGEAVAEVDEIIVQRVSERARQLSSDEARHA